MRETERSKTNGIMLYLDESKLYSTKKINEEYLNGLREMKMYGSFIRQRDDAVNVDTTLSEQWLEQSHLPFET